MLTPILSKIVLTPVLIIGMIVGTADKAHAQIETESVLLQDLTVSKVTDGDTIQVIDTAGVATNVRLACVDAPERTQKPHGLTSTNRLKAILPVGQSVILKAGTKRDRYNRVTAEVFLPDEEEPINMQLVAEGQSTVYTQYLSSCQDTADTYMQYENSAREQQIGVWADPEFILPSVFRRTCKLPAA